jgi:hypothetical protein
MNPMIRKPVPTAWLILMNSRLSATRRVSSRSQLRPSIDEIIYVRNVEHTLLAALDKLHAILEELLRDVKQFLDLIGHID